MAQMIRSAAHAIDAEASSVFAVHKAQQAKAKNGFGAKLLRAC